MGIPTQEATKKKKKTPGKPEGALGGSADLKENEKVSEQKKEA